MAVTTGTTGVSATPATDLYNLLATALTGNGNWTEQSDSPVSAVNAGTVDVVRVWKCTGGAVAFYVFIEVDNTNNRLRFRLSEYWDTTGHRLRQPAGGGVSAPSQDTVSVTPTANGTVTDADATIGSTNPLVAYAQVNVLGTAYNYLYEVRNNLITVGSKVTGLNYYAVAGCFTTLVQAISDTAPLVLLGHEANPGISGTAGSQGATNAGRFTRLPGFGASAITGGFCCCAWPIFPYSHTSGNPNTSNDNAYGSIAGINSNPWFAHPLASPAILQSVSSGYPAKNKGFRGYLPNFVVGQYTTEPLQTDTITIGGVTYYPLGKCMSYINGGQQNYIAIKG
jgi:hypothetical protein